MPTIQLTNGKLRYKTIPLYGGVKQINKEIAFKNLCLLKNVLDEQGVPFQLAYGTLLGAVREKDFITHDEDIDLFVLGENKQRLFDALPALIAVGFKVARYDRRDLLSVIKDEEYIDFYFYGKFSFDGKDMRICDGIVYPAFFFESSTKMNFKGEDFDVPAEYVFFLRCAYGKDWVTPVEYFNYEMPRYKRIINSILCKIKEMLPDGVFHYLAGKKEQKVMDNIYKRLHKRFHDDEELAQLCKAYGFELEDY